MIDTMKLAELAQEFMAVLEADHPEDELVEVGIVVAIRTEHNEMTTPTACSNDDRIYQTGLFQWALDTVEWCGERADDDIPPPEDDDDEAYP
jgi:hypothetical protein